MKKNLIVPVAITAALTLIPALTAAAETPAGWCLGEKPTIVGTNAGEVVWGTNGDDVIHARGGADTVYGLGGDDIICGGAGQDKVRGGPGNDVVVGSKGNDLVWGGPGDDKLLGGKGNDRLFGRLGNDDLYGQVGRDVCRQDSRLLGGKGLVRSCEVPRTTNLAFVPYNVMEAAAGLRVKGQNTGGEIFLGNHLMGNGGSNRVETEYGTAIAAGGDFDVELSFDASENALSAMVDAKSLTYDFDSQAAPGCDVADWDLLQVTMRERSVGVDLEFNGGSVNGESLKRDLGAPADGTTWTVEGIDFSRDWTLAGTLNASGGTWTGNENTKLEIMVGCKVQPQGV
ncbi:MAG: calcium-binding protein [Candidatus Limnocylindrales bacterium]